MKDMFFAVSITKLWLLSDMLPGLRLYFAVPCVGVSLYSCGGRQLSIRVAPKGDYISGTLARSHLNALQPERKLKSAILPFLAF